MASVEEDDDYESDPEQAKLSLTMRRREASDDDEGLEEEEDGGRAGRERSEMPRRIDSRVSDCESDGQGAAAEYDDEDSDLEEDGEEEEEDVEDAEYYDERESERERRVGVEAVPSMEAGKVVNVDGGVVLNSAAQGRKDNDISLVGTDGGLYPQEDQFGMNATGRGPEGKKENEPFAVPTAGAFYMHDDRFRDSAGGRHRRTLGGRKLWESRDDRKWGHDKFEEMSMQERHYEEGRRGSRGRNRSRSRNHGEDRGYSHGNRGNAYNNNNQNSAPKAVRGRGPRRYQPSMKNGTETPAQSVQPRKSGNKTSLASSGRAPVAASNLEPASVPPTKQVFASSLSVASPPFYPSGSSNKENSLTQKRDVQGGPINRDFRPRVMGEGFTMSQSQSMREKITTDSLGMDKLHINDSIPSYSGKPLTKSLLPASGPSYVSSTHPRPSRVQGKGPNQLGQMVYQATLPHSNQLNRVSSAAQPHAYERTPGQNRLQPSAPQKAALPLNSLEPVELVSSPESSNAKTALVGKGKGNVQGSGRASFPYAGGPVMGTSGAHVMQFGGQHPGGIGVPAVGMAFPGYVAQPNGLGNSEMTWLPVLTGAAGALGATYCPPYLTVDGSYHALPSGQASSLTATSSKENNTIKSGNELRPPQRPELANEEIGQRQNKARRYTEMKFDQ